MATIEEFIDKRRELNDIIKRIREKGMAGKLIRVLGEDSWDVNLIERNETASSEVAKDYSVCINMNETNPLFAHVELYQKVGMKIEQEALDKSYDKLNEIGAALEVC